MFQGDAQDLPQTMFVGMLSMGASLASPCYVRGKVRVSEEVPDQIHKFLSGPERDELFSDVEMLCEHRHRTDQLEAAATGQFEGAHIQSIHFAVMQCVQAYARAARGLCLVVGEYLPTLRQAEALQQPVGSQAPHLEVELAQAGQYLLPVVVQGACDHDFAPVCAPLLVRQLEAAMHLRLDGLGQVEKCSGFDHPGKQILHVPVLDEYRVIFRSQQVLPAQCGHLILTPADYRGGLS